MTEWLQYYDVYQTETFPHLIYFDSWEHANLLFHQNIPFDDTVQRMAAHNRAEYRESKVCGLPYFRPKAVIRIQSYEFLRNIPNTRCHEL